MFLTTNNCPTCCPDWGCGTNGAWLGQGIVFHELDASGQQANSARLKVGRFFDAEGNELGLEVHRDVLGGRCHVTDGHCNAGQLLEGNGLTDARLELLRVDSPAGNMQRYWLRIKDYSTTNFWVDPTEVTVPVYHFEFQKEGEGKDWLDVCRAPAEGGIQWQAISGMALIFRGDRYDEKAKTVQITGGADTWFNVACAGTTVAKMHLLRHTWAGNIDDNHATSRSHRQAVLKMFVADYLGDGKSFTVDGHPLMYSYDDPWVPKVPDDAGSVGYWSDAHSIDAVWGEHGAVCLNMPRLADTYAQIRTSILSQAQALNVGLPPCEPGLLARLQSLQPGDPLPWSGSGPASGYAISANHFPVP